MHCNISRIYILRERERERETKYRRSNGKLIWQCSLVSFVRRLVLDKVSFMLASLTRTLEALRSSHVFTTSVFYIFTLF